MQIDGGTFKIHNVPWRYFSNLFPYRDNNCKYQHINQDLKIKGQKNFFFLHRATADTLEE